MQAERLTTTAGVSLEGPLLFTPRVFADERGFFQESWNQRVFGEALEDAIFADNESRLRAAEELVTAEADQISSRSNVFGHTWFGGQPIRCDIDE